MNEYCCRHLLQNPASRPGRSSLLRPTSVPHLPQNRLSSATIGSDMMAAEGSSIGIGGTLTSPAPMRLREAVPRPVGAVRREGEVGGPLGRDPSAAGVSEVPLVTSPLPGGVTSGRPTGDPGWAEGPGWGALGAPAGREVAAVAVPAPVPLPLLATFTGPAVSASGSATEAAVASPAGRALIRPQTLQYPSSMTPVQPGVALHASPSITTISCRR